MPVATSSKKKILKKSVAKRKTRSNKESGYDQFKTFGDKQYTGMKVGRSHKWYYDKGEWKERKVNPDRWEISYAVTKRRAGKAPEGSGVPVGTGYHWFILSHQFVNKLNANDYSTVMVGLKLKLAHKRAGKDKWNITETTKRKHLVEMLEEFISELKSEPVKTEIIQLSFIFNSKKYEGLAVPMIDSCIKGKCSNLDITLNDQHLGTIRFTEKGWRMINVKPQKLVTTIGTQIEEWYNKTNK